MNSGRRAIARKEASALSLLSSLKSDVKGLLGIRADALASATFQLMTQQLLANDLDALKASIDTSQPSCVNERDGDHITLLHIAAEEGNLEAIKLLLSCDVDVDACDRNGWTPLHCAAYQGHEEVITLLLSASADCTMTTYDHNTALHYFVRSGDATHEYFEPVLAMLMKKAMDLLNLPNRLGETVLHFAALGNKVEAAKRLLAHGANANFANKYGETPLHVAARAGNMQLIQLFLDHGASPLKVGKNGSTADVARASNREEAFEFLTRSEKLYKERRLTCDDTQVIEAMRLMRSGKAVTTPAKPLPPIPVRKPTDSRVDQLGGGGNGNPPAPPARRPTVNALPVGDNSAQLGHLARASVACLVAPNECVDPVVLSSSSSEPTMQVNHSTCELEIPYYEVPEATAEAGDSDSDKSGGEEEIHHEKHGRKRKRKRRRHVIEEEEVITSRDELLEETPLTRSQLDWKKRVSIMVLAEQEKPIEVPEERRVPLTRLVSWEQLPVNDAEKVDFLEMRHEIASSELIALRERAEQAEMELAMAQKLLENTQTRLRNAQNDNYRLQKKVERLEREAEAKAFGTA